jgi:hypothetical protein
MRYDGTMGRPSAKATTARLLLLALIASSLPSCKDGSGGQAAAAAIVVGAAVAAAAINRAATDECWGNCPPGTYCDEGSGLCIAPDEQLAAPPEENEVEWVECDAAEFECAANQWLRCEKRCEWVMCGPDDAAPSSDDPQRCCRQPCAWVDCYEDGRPCEPAAKTPSRRAPAVRATGAPHGAERATTNAGPANTADPCRGLCLAGERCVVRDAVADCVAAER